MNLIRSNSTSWRPDTHGKCNAFYPKFPKECDFEGILSPMLSQVMGSNSMYHTESQN